MKVLCVVAHGDDESFFAGGALALHALTKDKTVVVALSDGEGARFDRPDDTFTEKKQARRLAFHLACEVLGAWPLHLDVFPDQQSDTVPQLSINRAVEAVLIEYRPDLVYTHHVGDLNLDHRRVAEAVLVATRQGPLVRCMTPEWPTRCVGPSFKPTKSIMVGGHTLEAKIQACRCYQGEMREYPHPRSEQAMREQTYERFVEIR